MRLLVVSVLFFQAVPSVAQAESCETAISPVSDVRRVESALFPEQFMGQQEHIRWGTYGSDNPEEGSWTNFIWESVKKVKFDGVVDRYLEVQKIQKAIDLQPKIMAAIIAANGGHTNYMSSGSAS